MLVKPHEQALESAKFYVIYLKADILLVRIVGLEL